MASAALEKVILMNEERTKKLKVIIKQLKKDGVRCTCSPNGRKWSLPSATCPGHTKDCELYKQANELI
jgi:hypothetical protein